VTCFYCDEEMVDGEALTDTRPERFHRECLVRIVSGSVGHQMHECECYGGTRGDPPGLSLREAARAAHALYLKLHPLPRCQ